MAHSDIVTEILEKTVDDYEEGCDGATLSATALREGIASGKLEDAEWVLSVLESDSTPVGVEGD